MTSPPGSPFTLLAMAKLSFATFPECCQKLLRQLEKEARGGSRNCEKGHAVSLEYARALEARSKPQGSPSADSESSEPSAA